MKRISRADQPATVRDPDAALMRRTGRRIGLQAAGLVSIIVVILIATAIGVLLHSQQLGASALLEQANARAIDVLDPPNGVYLIARTADGRLVSTPGLPAGLADVAALHRTAVTGHAEAFDLRLNGRSYTARTVRRGDGVTLEAILDLTDDHSDRNRLVAAMLISGALGLILAAAAGAWLGVRATRPLGVALALQHRFISDASHELRTPLTLLSTRAQVLRRQLRAIGSPADVDDTATRVITDAQRLAAILDDLLIAANPVTEQEHVPIDLVRLAADVVAEVEVPSAGTVTVTGPLPGRADDSSEADGIIVVGSPIALRRAVTALIDNAIRHARSTVQVSVHRLGRRAALDVVDDGPGVDRELAGKLFLRFASTRVHGRDGRRHYGLGLALVSEILAAHNGTVALIEPLSPGSTFRITLPISRR